MSGWHIFILLLLLILWYGERKKVTRRISEVEFRLAHVEELLLEVCALVEEGESGSEPAPSAVLENKKEEDRKEAKEESPAPIKPSPVATVSSPENKAAGPSEKPPVLSSPSGTVAQVAQPEREEKKGRKPKVPLGKLPEWHQQIIELWQQGLPIPEIARQTGKGQGEVQLILDLYCKERPQS